MIISAAFISALAASVPQERVTVTAHFWAPFISPMGEPFTPKSESDDTLAAWFRQADRNHDGLLSSAEMQADADRFFKTLDTDGDGEIDPDELVRYEWQVAPQIQVNSRLRRQPGEKVDPKKEAGEQRRTQRRDDSLDPQGAARYGLLNIPQPVAAADLDLNRGVSRGEFQQAAIYRFGLLDTGHTGALRLDQLQVLRTARLMAPRPKKTKDAVDGRVGVPLPPGR